MDGDVSCGIGLIKIHTQSQCNESSYFNDMELDVENGYVSGGHFFMKSHTLSEANNHNCVHYTKKRDRNVLNVN